MNKAIIILAGMLLVMTSSSCNKDESLMLSRESEDSLVIPIPDISNYIAQYTTEGSSGTVVTEHTWSFELINDYTEGFGESHVTMDYSYGLDVISTPQLLHYIGKASSQEYPEPTYPSEVTPIAQFSNSIMFTDEDGEVGFLWASWQDEDSNDWTTLKSFRIEWQEKHIWFTLNE